MCVFGVSLCCREQCFCELSNMYDNTARQANSVIEIRKSVGGELSECEGSWNFRIDKLGSFI